MKAKGSQHIFLFFQKQCYQYQYFDISWTVTHASNAPKII